MIDIAFDAARDVGSIRYRLHPLDVGFDLREDNTTVQIEHEPELRVSYPAEDGERRVMSGPAYAVVARLRELGFRVALTPEYLYTTVGDYQRAVEDCTGEFFGQDGEILPGDAPITVSADGEWCAGHDDGNQTWEDLE